MLELIIRKFGNNLEGICIHGYLQMDSVESKWVLIILDFEGLGERWG